MGLEAVEVYSADEVQVGVKDLAVEVKGYYGDIDNLLVTGLLTGAYIFVADFTRVLGHDLGMPHQVAFMGVSSQEPGQTAGVPRVSISLPREITGMHVLLADDLLETGNTIDTVLGILAARNPESIELMTLFYKEGLEEVDVPVRFKGLPVPKKYVEGVGLDDASQKGRWRRNLIYWSEKS